MKIFYIKSLFKLPDDFSGSRIDAIKLMANHLEEISRTRETKFVLADTRNDNELLSEFQNQVENEDKLCLYLTGLLNFEKREMTPEIIAQNAQIVNSVPCPRCKVAVGKDCVNSKGQFCKNPHNVRIALYQDMDDPVGKQNVDGCYLVDGVVKEIYFTGDEKLK